MYHEKKSRISFLERLKEIFAKIKLKIKFKNINIGNNSGVIGDGNEQHQHRK